MQCTICRTRVRGLVFLCEQCNHGGHMDHLSQWFRGSSPRQCPDLNCHSYIPVGGSWLIVQPSDDSFPALEVEFWLNCFIPRSSFPICADACQTG
ncbi:unnamed protein product [Echinostoma caproni]|uniref:WDR59/RTC1-like RING zinc finger domain-containing protein n=1 Tax=Echinostoma caproni TaxID=27848 RepID=A0A3P8GUA7_9TREM|nr:unnamed protein product [Echinostoma caproni]